MGHITNPFIIRKVATLNILLMGGLPNFEVIYVFVDGTN